jgi:SAM-dependent methyltransferase
VTEQEPIFAGGGAYERFMGRWSRCLAPLLVEFAGVADGGRVLDVGCGTGALCEALTRARPSLRATGVDPSAAFVREAEARAPVGRARFVVADAQALTFPDATFDASLSLLAMNFVPDPARALTQMIRVTRRHGIVAAAVWDYGDGMEMLRAFWDEAVALDAAGAGRDERHMPLCAQGQLGALWRAGGLDRVEERAMAIDLPFESFDDYWRPFLGGQGPAGAYAAALTGPERVALEARLRRRLLGSQRDGAFTLRARAWAARGIVAG